MNGYNFTERVRKVLTMAREEAARLHHEYVGTEHILLGLLSEGDGVAARVLTNLGLDTEVTRQNILRELDPNFSAPAEDTAMRQKPEPQKSQREPVDINKRYDVYCREGDREVVYRSALFKGIKTLFQKENSDLWAEYIELEQADGQTVFIARQSVIKFSEHGTTPGSEIESQGR